MRRTLIIAAAVIVLLGVGVGVYFLFFNKGATVSVGPGTTLPSAGDRTPVSPVTPDTITPSQPTTVTERLVKISAGPVVPGEVVLDGVATASSTAEATVEFLERESGNVYSYTTRAGTLTRISNKTVPGIQSATWLPDGSFAFVRYLTGTDSTTVNTYALSATGASGFFLPQNLSSIDISTSSVLTLASGVNGSIASLVQTDGTHATEIFSTPLSSLRLSFAGKNQYLAATSPTATLPGAIFTVDSRGSFSRIAGPLNGLTAKASPSGKWALISYVDSGSLLTGIVNTITGQYLPVPIATIADKCVWAADESAIYCGVPVDPPTGYNYPDDWYQGAVSFSDRIWKIQVAGRYAQLVLNFTKETSTPLDAEALAIDPLLTTLVFVNKTDGSLWKYSL